MSQHELQPVFIAGERGRILLVLRRPAHELRGGVLIIPPFAEEMNKSRHLFGEVASRLCALGIATVIVDLFGTGDSEGEFGEADWSIWKADLAACIAWCESREIAVTALLSLRLGCALACEAVGEKRLTLKGTVFWQPVLSGRRALDQFLRLRVAATMMQKEGKESVAALRDRLKRGEGVEVAGYRLNRRLVEQVDAVELASRLDPALGRTLWLELIRSADAAPATPALNAIEGARARGMDVELRTVEGEPFWSSVEIVRNPELVALTVQALSDAHG